MRKESFYKNSLVLNPGRKLLAGLLDFFVAFILSCVLFFIAEGIGNHTPITSEAKTNLASSQSHLFSLVTDAKLDEKDLTTGYLKGSSVISKRYMTMSVLAALKRSGETDISTTTYAGYNPITPETDNSYYYYVTFKTSASSSFASDDSSLSLQGKEEYKSKLFSLTSASYFETGDYPYLSSDTAKLIDSYFRDSYYAKGKAAYDSIYGGYKEMLDAGVKEYQTYYEPYKSEYASYISYRNTIYNAKLVEVSLSYALSIIVCFLIVPLSIDRGRTVSYLVMSIGVTDREGLSPKAKSIVIKSLVNVLEYPLIMPITVFVLFSTDSLNGLMTYSLLGSFSLMSVGLFSLVFILLGWLFCFVNRQSKQSISEFLSGLVVKDGREFKVQKEGKNGRAE